MPVVYGFLLGSNGYLGADPVKEFEHFLGLWALRFLVITLAITPLKVLISINLLRFRRAFGLLTFWYAFFHLIAYLALDLKFEFSIFFDDITKRPFIILGMLAFIIFLALALTSNKWSIKNLGKKWSWLHSFIYLAAILVIVHFYLARKLPQTDFIIYTVILVLLIGFRLSKRFIKFT